MKAQQEIIRREPQLVPGAHRVVRRLSAEEGPYPGTLVTRGDGVAVLRDVEEVSGWDGWRHAGSRHVVGPLDLVRRVDGHDVLLPWCTERVAGFIGQRGLGEPALSAGEVGTLVVSLLRGIDESTSSGTLGSGGEWWLTEEGCPTFVIGAGSRADARAAAADLVAALEDGCADRALRRLLGAICDGLRAALQRPDVPRRQLLGWEAELLEIAAPRPLLRVERRAEARESDVARGVRDPVVSEPTRKARMRSRVRSGRSARTRGGDSNSGGFPDSFVVSLFRRSVEWMSVMGARLGRRKTRGPRVPLNPASAGIENTRADRGRRVPKIVVGLGAAALVLAGGALWPGGATGEPTEARPIETAPGEAGDGAVVTARTAEESPSPPTDESSRSAEPSAEPREEDPVAAAPRRLRAIEECADSGDAECRGAVAAGSVGVVDVLGSDRGPGAEPEFILLDVYGDIAVIRMSSPLAEEADGPGAFVLVLVKTDEKWLVRDVYDAADQPE
ncbi:hypothetical protein [Microbacterium hydrocarbonoxydans]|uniref:hypothetical protein n=1 Tax=Microbacterium hydrocarbonoxydans TaxID=273678 RepID=UPI002041B10C|nr:hypothetical protein [Microbacterium hydrocarbonoxydans]MCM3780466.1 hypothetical protein [Microbacterium hydrocarbonoxydans]